MSLVQIALSIVSPLFAGVMGVLISAFYYRRYENRKIRFDTFRRFMANRFDLTGDLFSQALNEIFAVFKNSRTVIKALVEYHAAVTSGNDSQPQLLALFRAMCRDLHLKIEDIDDTFFLVAFNVRRPAP